MDLAEQYAKVEPTDLQLALSPPSNRHMLEITFNGRRQTITRFPVLGLKRLSGEWRVTAKVIPIEPTAGGSARVDSCVAFPYGGGSHSTLVGGNGTIRLGSSGEAKEATIPLVIFWSQD